MRAGLKLGACKRTESLPVDGEHDLVESGQMEGAILNHPGPARHRGGDRKGSNAMSGRKTGRPDAISGC
jgi:hypothetical protein